MSAATGTKSRRGSYGSSPARAALYAWTLVLISSVYPSGVACATSAGAAVSVARWSPRSPAYPTPPPASWQEPGDDIDAPADPESIDDPYRAVRKGLVVEPGVEDIGA